MNLYKSSLRNVYRYILEDIMTSGNYSSPKNDGTINRKIGNNYIYDACIELYNNGEDISNLLYIPGRSFSLVYALNELLMMFSHEDKLKYFTSFNSNIANFSDNGEILRGNYGKRINSINGFEKVVKLLSDDKNSRQAVIPIYNSTDVAANSKDIPCTLFMNFRVNGDQLDMVVYMRSNDAIWGLPYDVFNFTNIQKVLSRTLNLKQGRYIHHVSNLHVYENHFDLVNKILEEDKLQLCSIYTNYNLKECREKAEVYTQTESFSYTGDCFNLLDIEKCFREYGKTCKDSLDYYYKVFPDAKYFTKRYLQSI